MTRNFPAIEENSAATANAVLSIVVAASTIVGAARAPVRKCRASLVKCRRCDEVPGLDMKGPDNDGFLPIDVGKVPVLDLNGATDGEKVRGGEEQRPDLVDQRAGLIGKRPTDRDSGLERSRNNSEAKTKCPAPADFGRAGGFGRSHRGHLPERG
jgi:hypothetical protein